MREQNAQRDRSNLYRRPLYLWGSEAHRLLPQLETVKRGFISSAQRLDQSYQYWRWKTGWPRAERSRRDARRTYFYAVQTIIRNAQFGLIFIRDHLTDPAFWKREANTENHTVIASALVEWATNVQWSYLQQLAMVTEATLRSIVLAQPSLWPGDPARLSLYKAGDLLLRHVSRTRYRKLFLMLALIRNTIHNNGVLFPERGRSRRRQITYRRRTIFFRPGQAPQTIDAGLMILMGDWLNEAMLDIVTSPKIRVVSHCPERVR